MTAAVDPGGIRPQASRWNSRLSGSSLGVRLLIVPGDTPSVSELLDVDREYREKAAAGELQRIAPPALEAKRQEPAASCGTWLAPNCRQLCADTRRMTP